MPREIELLAWTRAEEGTTSLQNSLSAFELMPPRAKVLLTIPGPGMMWTEIVKTALYGRSADLAEVGSTYVASLREMNSLRPFTKTEINTMGGSAAFLASAWQRGFSSEDERVWAIPWTMDARVIFYRRDLLAKAGVDEQGAFQTPATMEQTLRALQASGAEIPITLSTASPHSLATLTATWIWENGGDFIDASGNQVIFNSPEARAGLRNYFSMGRYFGKSHGKLLDIEASDRLFWEGKAAVAITGTWLPQYLDEFIPPDVKNNLGVTLLPGTSVVGGTHLVVWKHCRDEQSATELIRFLTSHETLISYPKSIGIPARVTALDSEVYARTYIYQTFIEAIKAGRPVPASLPLWAVVEDRLGKTLAQIWSELDRRPDANLDELIADFIDPLATRLNATLKTD